MADIGKAPEGFPRRMQAARALAGLDIPELAKKINQRGLGERSLRSIESGETDDVQKGRRDAIMQACGLPDEFAGFDFWLLEPLAQALQRTDVEGEPSDLILRAFRALEDQPDRDRIALLERDVERLYDHIIAQERAANVPTRRRLRFPRDRQRAQAAPPGNTRHGR